MNFEKKKTYLNANEANKLNRNETTVFVFNLSVVNLMRRSFDEI